MVLDRRCRAFRFPCDRDGVLDVDEEIIAPAEPQLCRDDFSCEIVVGSWVGISQVKIKSSLSRSALLFFADGCGVIINTSSSDILFDNIVIRNPAIISFDT